MVLRKENSQSGEVPLVRRNFRPAVAEIVKCGGDGRELGSSRPGGLQGELLAIGIESRLWGAQVASRNEL